MTLLSININKIALLRNSRAAIIRMSTRLRHVSWILVLRGLRYTHVRINVMHVIRMLKVSALYANNAVQS